MAGGSTETTGDLAAHYSRRFAVAVARLLGTEGSKFVDDPADRGGATKFGVSIRFLQLEGKFDPTIHRDFDLNMDGDLDVPDIRLLTMAGAVSLYWRCFWNRNQLESFPEPIGEVLLDQEVNDGTTAANKLLQRAINACSAHLAGVERLEIDGVLGGATRGAMQAVLSHPALGMPALLEALREAARVRYRAIVHADPRQAKFLKGWLARANQLGVGW